MVATDMHKRRASQAGRFANSTKVEWTLTARGTSLSFADGRSSRRGVWGGRRPAPDFSADPKRPGDRAPRDGLATRPLANGKT
ncbi:hypothetical protein KL86PLE_30311 [uncultured Pleomorphomonas sp.]|uniref:Uncharacterized protein n=1 Tax=uncultured Pleomorphomonas sp. TaxID=442121 RepID=A0A212LE58_9HYPH|nr:hypothetical protein KL86PLE_30311 [uncultured Pleomorphomonas sp.]